MTINEINLESCNDENAPTKPLNARDLETTYKIYKFLSFALQYLTNKID